MPYTLVWITCLRLLFIKKCPPKLKIAYNYRLATVFKNHVPLKLQKSKQNLCHGRVDKSHINNTHA